MKQGESNYSDDLRNLIFMDTHAVLRGKNGLPMSDLLRLQARGWVSKANDLAGYQISNAGRSEIARALAAPQPAEAAANWVCRTCNELNRSTESACCRCGQIHPAPAPYDDAAVERACVAAHPGFSAMKPMVQEHFRANMRAALTAAGGAEAIAAAELRGYLRGEKAASVRAELHAAQPAAAVPDGWRAAAEAVAYRGAVTPLDAVYAAFEALDNGDVELEQWPQRAVDALTIAGWAVVPCALPYEILGQAQVDGAFETGNPKHGWDYLLAKTRLGPLAAAPQPEGKASCEGPDDCARYPECGCSRKDFRVISVPAGRGDSVGPMDLTAPPKVWLQIDDHGNNEDRSEPINPENWGDLTWCYESIGGQEVVYIRQDLAAPVADAEALASEIGEFVEFQDSSREWIFQPDTLAEFARRLTGAKP